MIHVFCQKRLSSRKLYRFSDRKLYGLSEICLLQGWCAWKGPRSALSVGFVSVPLRPSWHLWHGLIYVGAYIYSTRLVLMDGYVHANLSGRIRGSD